MGTASLYLKKPVLPPISEYRNLLFRRDPIDPDDLPDQDHGAAAFVRDNRERFHTTDRRNNRGSEVKVMRRIKLFGDSNFKSCPLDIGVGIRAGLDPVVKVEPVARIRAWNTLTLKLWPMPVIKFSRRLPFHYQGMQAHFRYEIPISALKDPWWEPPARMLIRFEHGSNSGFHFYPGGIELGDHSIPLGPEEKSILRVAAGLNFPREYPIHPENETVWEIYRLGLKTVW